jgi:hypothetical protein
MYLFHCLKLLPQVDHEMRDGLEHKIERELVNDLRARALSNDSAGEAVPNPILNNGNELRSRNPASTSAAAAAAAAMDNNL